MMVANLQSEPDSTAQHQTADWSAVTKGIAAGDSESLRVYYEHYFDVMLRQARKITQGDEATCLDIVQDAMLKVIRCLRPMADADRLTAWTRAVVNSVAYDGLRRRRRKREAETQGAIDAITDRLDDLEREARIAWIEEQIEAMEPSLRRLVAWRYRWGWTLNQIAARCGLKIGAVDGRIRRAVEQLKQKAEQEFDD